MGVLGCAERYQAIIHYQGGSVAFYEIPQQQIVELTWQRTLDNTSVATVKLARQGMGVDCCAKIGELDAWGFELSLYRDGDLVWQGPLYDILEDPYNIYLEARDVIGYLDHRANEFAWSFVNIDVANVAFLIMDETFTVHDPNVFPYIDVQLTGTLIDWAVDAKSVYIGDELRDLAKIGFDFTTMGRSIIGRPERTASQYTTKAPVLTQSHFAGTLQIRRPGSETVTRATVIGDAITYTTADPPVDSFYGLVDVIEKADRVTDIAVITKMGDQLLADGYPTPTYIVLPPEARLLPSAPITVKQLMPSERIDVYLSEGFCRTVRQSFKLLQVNGRWISGGDQGSGGETISISLGQLPG